MWDNVMDDVLCGRNRRRTTLICNLYPCSNVMSLIPKSAGLCAFKPPKGDKKIKSMSAFLPVKSVALVVIVDNPGWHVSHQMLTARVEAGEVACHQGSLVPGVLEQVPVVGLRCAQPVASCGILQRLQVAAFPARNTNYLAFSGHL